MPPSGADHQDRAALAAPQAERLRALLAAALPHNRFYARKFAAAGVHLSALSTHHSPLTTQYSALSTQHL